MVNIDEELKKMDKIYHEHNLIEVLHDRVKACDSSFPKFVSILDIKQLNNIQKEALDTELDYFEQNCECINKKYKEELLKDIGQTIWCNTCQEYKKVVHSEKADIVSEDDTILYLECGHDELY